MSSYSQEAKRKATGLQGWISVVVNTLLFVLKYWAGVTSGSVAIIADAWHTLSDSLSSIIVIVSARISSKPADKDHPFGHGRFEIIATILIAVLLFIVAWSFCTDAFEKFRDKQTPHYGTVAIVVTVISVLVKEGLATYAFMMAKRHNSSTLRADGWHHRSDAISSLVILIGIFLARKIWWIDSLLAFIVALLIAQVAFSLLKEAINTFLGEEASSELKERINTIVYEIAGEQSDTHHFHYHNYQGHAEVTFHMRFPGSMKIEQTHILVDAVEKRIREELDVEATIHCEPLK